MNDIQSTAVDNNIDELLCTWNLQHLYDHFIEHRITLEVLKILKPKHIDSLFYGLAVGDLAVFEENFEKWKLKNMDVVKPNNQKQTSDISLTTTTSKNCITNNKICSVMTILKDTHNGRAILKYYDENNILHEDQRQLLIKTIASYVDVKGITCSVSDTSQMESEICSIFPTEELEYYNNGKRGKIYHKIYNLKRLSKQICESKGTLKDENSNEFVPESDASIALTTLRSGNVTEDELDIYWRKCSQYRFLQMQNSNSTEEILKEWPEYIKPSGFRLIDIDFGLKHVDAKDLKLTWSFHEKNLIQILKTKATSATASKQLQDLDSLDEESKTLCIFWHVHTLFPPQQKVLTDKQGAKFRKKFSVTDSQESFALIARSKEELDVKLNLLKLQNLNIQPRLLIIGSTVEVKEIFLFFDGIKYPILKVLTAVDLLFKTFFVFNLAFPNESEIFYTFLQIFFYEMPSNTKLTKIFTVKNEILNLNKT